MVFTMLWWKIRLDKGAFCNYVACVRNLSIFSKNLHENFCKNNFYKKSSCTSLFGIIRRPAILFNDTFVTCLFPNEKTKSLVLNSHVTLANTYRLCKTPQKELINISPIWFHLNRWENGNSSEKHLRNQKSVEVLS